MQHANFTSANQNPGLLFWQVSTLWQRKIKEALAPYNITHTQFVILAVIHELTHRGFSVTQKEVSNFSMVDVMTVSTTLRLMEKKQCITRHPHPDDTRAKQIANTPKGEALLAQVTPVIKKVDGGFFFETPQATGQFMAQLEILKAKQDE